MEKEIQKNTETSAVLGNEIRWQMVEMAGKVKTQKFKFSDIVNKEKTKRSEQMQQYSFRWLQACFQELIKAGIFIKVEKTYKYTLNTELISGHSKAIEQLTT